MCQTQQLKPTAPTQATFSVAAQDEVWGLNGLWLLYLWQKSVKNTVNYSNFMILSELLRQKIITDVAGAGFEVDAWNARGARITSSSQKITLWLYLLCDQRFGWTGEPADERERDRGVDEEETGSLTHDEGKLQTRSSSLTQCPSNLDNRRTTYGSSTRSRERPTKQK